jgi:hypothetical protein
LGQPPTTTKAVVPVLVLVQFRAVWYALLYRLAMLSPS